MTSRTLLTKVMLSRLMRIEAEAYEQGRIAGVKEAQFEFLCDYWLISESIHKLDVDDFRPGYKDEETFETGFYMAKKAAIEIVEDRQ